MIITLRDSELDADELHQETLALVENPYIKELTEERVSLIPREKVPEGAMTFGSFVLGVLNAEVSLENLIKLLKFIEGLRDKQLNLEVESPYGGKLKINTNNEKDFEFLYKKAKEWKKNN